MPVPKDKLRLGGMALRNGLLVHGPTHWAAAVRRPDGSLEIASERKPELVPGLVTKVPGLRGPVKLAEAMLVLPLVRKRMRSARLPFEDPRVLVATASTLAISSLMRRRGPATASREGLLQAIGAIPAVVALTDRDLAAYHGAEHKAIAAYEQGVEDVASVPKEHDRCGSNLIVPMMLLSAAGTILLERLVDKPSQAARAVVSLAGASHEGGERSLGRGWWASPVTQQDSSLLGHLALSQVLVIRPAFAPKALAGSPCEILRLPQ